jgi:hypothetical protein
MGTFAMTFFKIQGVIAKDLATADVPRRGLPAVVENRLALPSNIAIIYGKDHVSMDQK